MRSRNRPAPLRSRYKQSDCNAESDCSDRFRPSLPNDHVLALQDLGARHSGVLPLQTGCLTPQTSGDSNCEKNTPILFAVKTGGGNTRVKDACRKERSLFLAVQLVHSSTLVSGERHVLQRAATEVCLASAPTPRRFVFPVMRTSQMCVFVTFKYSTQHCPLESAGVCDRSQHVFHNWGFAPLESLTPVVHALFPTPTRGSHPSALCVCERRVFSICSFVLRSHM